MAVVVSPQFLPENRFNRYHVDVFFDFETAQRYVIRKAEGKERFIQVCHWRRERNTKEATRRREG